MGGTVLIIALENARHELIDLRDNVKDLGSALRMRTVLLNSSRAFASASSARRSAA